MSYFVHMAPRWAPWMSKNLALAAVPLLLGFVLFRTRRRHLAPWWLPLWWLGLVAFVLFLPNAPYPAADIRWLWGEVRNAWAHEPLRFLVLVPVWALYVGLGMGAFVGAVRLAQVRATASWSETVGRVVVVALCLASSIGVYLGRQRLNSWDVVTEPSRVLRAVRDLPRVSALGWTCVAALALLGCYAAVTTLVRRLVPRAAGHPADPSL